MNPTSTIREQGPIRKTLLAAGLGIAGFVISATPSSSQYDASKFNYQGTGIGGYQSLVDIPTPPPGEFYAVVATATGTLDSNVPPLISVDKVPGGAPTQAYVGIAGSPQADIYVSSQPITGPDGSNPITSLLSSSPLAAQGFRNKVASSDGRRPMPPEVYKRLTVHQRRAQQTAPGYR